jgi:hypothetical protein
MKHPNSSTNAETSKAEDNGEQDQENGGGYVRDEVMSLVEFQMLDIIKLKFPYLRHTKQFDICKKS